MKITLQEHGQAAVAEPSEEGEMSLVSVVDSPREDEMPTVSVVDSGEDSSETSGDAPDTEPPAGGTDAPFLLRLFRPNR